MPRISGRLRPLVVGLAVIVILLVVVPRNSSAQTAGSLSLGEIAHSADGTTVATLSASPDELASLAVFVDGEPVPFEVGESGAETSSRVIFAVENSVSMTPVQLAEVQSAMRSLVESLGASDQVGLVTFGGGASAALTPTTDRTAFDSAVNAIALDGGSALYSGVATSAELAAGNPSSLIVLVTYGWDWGSVSTHSREASISAVAEEGASVYVQSMVFDGSVDVAYLAPLATDGVVRDAPQVAAIAGASSLLGAGAPARTLTIDAPALALGEHELRVTSALGTEQNATFEVTNDGLLSLSVVAGAESTDPIAVRVTSGAALSSFEVTATLAGTALEIARDGTATIDPWAFVPGTASLEVSASVDGAPAGAATRSVAIPSLEPTLTVDLSNEEVLEAMLLAQPGTADTLVAVVDGAVFAESETGSLRVDRPEAGALTFEARAADQVVASEQVSATEVIESVVPNPETAAGSGGSSILTSPATLAIPVALILFALLVIRRRSPRPAGEFGTAGELGTASELGTAEAEPDVEADPPAPPSELVVPAAEIEPEAEPIPLPVSEDQPAKKSRFSMFDRGKSSEEPTPIQPAQWAVMVRSADGLTRRVEVGYEPVSIGASKLCTVTLAGDAVRFVHLVIAREGHEVRAHQFGPVLVNGQDQNVEDGAVLTEAIMEIGDVSIWLEQSVAESAAVDAA